MDGFVFENTRKFRIAVLMSAPAGIASATAI